MFQPQRWVKRIMDSVLARETLFVAPPVYSTAFSASCHLTRLLSTKIGSLTMASETLARETHWNIFVNWERRFWCFSRLQNWKKAGKFMSLRGNDEFNATVCFWSDTFHHLNQLSVELQGWAKRVSELVEKFHVFLKKALTLFSWSLSWEDASLPHMKEIQPANYQGGFRLLWLIKKDFASRFDDFSISRKVMRFVKDPFCVNVEVDFALEGRDLGPSLDEGFSHWNSLTFSHQVNCDSHRSRKVLKGSGPMSSAKRSFHSHGVLLFFFWQCLAQHTLVSPHSHTSMPIKHTIASPSLISIIKTCSCQV